MPAGNARQVQVWRWHRDVCRLQAMAQSTFKHKSLAGTISAPSSTGVTEYVPPGPLAAEGLPATSDTAVWFFFLEAPRPPNNEQSEALGRMGAKTARGQMPAVDDNGNVFTVTHDDWIAPPDGKLYRVTNPILSVDQSYWTFEMVEQR